MTYVDVLRPSVKPHALLYDIFWIVGGALFIALSARFAIPLPFSPVPVTGQTLAVLLTGALLGSRRGSLGVLVYLAAGGFGLPAFTGGATGLAHLAGPTGGYLAGFLVAAFLVGMLAERGWDRQGWTTFLAMAFGNIVIYVFGLFWLARFVGSERVLAAGLLPFIPGDLLKLLLATLLLPWGWKFLRKNRLGEE